VKFTSTETYIAADDLAIAVNAAVTLERPLLVKGEPGTGKTELARQVATSLGMEIIERESCGRPSQAIKKLCY
jgi:MoxR-like ATPase